MNQRNLSESSVVKEILTTATDGKSYPVEHYSLDMVLAVGYRVKMFTPVFLLMDKMCW